MAFAIVILVVVSVLVVILENGISAFSHHDLKDLTSAPPNDSAVSSKCWLAEKSTVKSECVKCSDFDLQVKHSFCLETGHKQLVNCEKSGDQYRSCEVPRDTAAEEKHFWIFEATTFVVGLISYGIVILRQKRLDKHFLEKINKQIASGV